MTQRGKEIFAEHGKDFSRDEFQTLKGDRPSRRRIRRVFGSWNTFKDECLGRADSVEKETFTQDFKENTGTLESRSTRITSLDEALEYFDVDRDMWEVDRYTVNKWEVGAKNAQKQIEISPLYQVKIWLKRRKEVYEQSVKAELEAVLSEIRTTSPEVKAWTPKEDTNSDRYLYEICIFDLHLAKLAWAAETGEDYDSDIARQLYVDAIADLMYKAQGFNIERILLPTGNDFFHIDNMDNTTTAGTQQDVDTRWQRAFKLARVMLTDVIRQLATVAPVTVPIIPGNHDTQRTYYLGELLDAVFDGNENVTIDNSPKSRKYHPYGSTLIGYAHCKDEKPESLPLIMATEECELWAKSKFRLWHIGHKHRKNETRVKNGDTYNGVQVVMIPSLSGADAWHYHKGYIKTFRAAEAYLYHRETGPCGYYTSTVIDNKIAV